MTALLHRPTPTPTNAPLDLAAWAIGTPRLLAGLDPRTDNRLGGRDHLAVHGPVPGTDLDRILAFLDAAALAGRGGAGFPLAAKLRALDDTTLRRREVIVNGSESEPASRKDRVLLRRTPHLVLDGALSIAAAIGARAVTVAVHDPVAAESVRCAVAERPDAKRVIVRVVAGGFVAGEARALVRQLRGGPALPPGRRTPPTVDGVVVGNVETFAQLAVLLRLGPQRFAETGTSDEPGTTLITVGGAVGRPGVVELPIGTPLGILLTAAHAAPPQAVIVGGYHGSWIAPVADTRLSRAGLRSAGASFGAGVVLVLDDRTCALGELARVADWLAGESARQCGPCHFGLPALAADIANLAAAADPARRTAAVGSAFEHARSIDGRGSCAHPDGAVRFVVSALHHLHDENDAHIAHGSCGRPVLNQLPVGGPR